MDYDTLATSMNKRGPSKCRKKPYRMQASKAQRREYQRLMKRRMSTRRVIDLISGHNVIIGTFALAGSKKEAT